MFWIYSSKIIHVTYRELWNSIYTWTESRPPVSPFRK